MAVPNASEPAEKESSFAGVEVPKYSEKEKNYLASFMERVEQAAVTREQDHPEFDGMSLTRFVDENEKLANTFIEPRKNPEDSTFQSGTPRDKMLALSAAISNLNLSVDISAYDESRFRLGTVGDAMEDTFEQSEELDKDEEKKLLRHIELMKNGFVFVEEIWDDRWMMDKSVTKGGVFDGKLEGMKWTSRLRRLFSQPSRNILPPTSVFLGDIRQYDFSMQPYFFTFDVKTYNEAETIFGQWERWKNVPKTFRPTLFEWHNKTYDNLWERFNIGDGEALIIRFQDKWNNEYGIVINGVLMTPVGLPLVAINGFADYNVTQQNFEPIHSKFAYGNSLMRKLRTKTALYDEMLRLGVLKTQQSYKEPLINVSGQIVSRHVFAPGNITNNPALAGKLLPVVEGKQYGVTNNELAMIQKMKEQIDESSVSPTFQGQKQGVDPTATEVVELQRQARLMLGLTILACSLLEWKLGWLRLFNVLARWFEPEDRVVQDARGELLMKKTFRRTAVSRFIEGEGEGMRMVVPTEEELPSPQEVKEAEDELTKRNGVPTRVIFLKPNEMKNAKITWRLVVRPKEKMTNEMSKLLFRAELSDLKAFGPMVNLQYLAEKFSRVWGEDPRKLFRQAPVEALQGGEGAAPSKPTKIAGVPTAEGEAGMGRQVPKPQ